LQLVNAIRDDVRAFVMETERSDDLTILVLRWNGGGA
jgi:serine phosphatase RsbU (regulator of sigma subunit)